MLPKKATFLLVSSPSLAKFDHLLHDKLPLLQARLLVLRVFEQAAILSVSRFPNALKE